MITSRSSLPLIACLMAAALCAGCSDDEIPVTAAPEALDQCEPFPERQMGGSPALDAVVQDPARCGLAAYSWLDDPSLGEVRERVQRMEIQASWMSALIEGEGIVPPRPLEHDVRVDQVRYLTQDRGKLVEATMMVAYPFAPEDEEADAEPQQQEPLDVILVLHGTTGFNDECAPSMEQGSRALAAVFAAMGYVVVAPDYIGLKGLGEPTGFPHPYLVGEPTAISSLDALRAAGRLDWQELTGRCVRPRIVTFGGSQGGHAALWVDRLLPYYAPEFNMLGMVATVPPADIEGQMTRALRELVPATGNSIAFLDLAANWYGYEDRLGEVFTEQALADLPPALETTCDGGDAIDKFTSLETLFQPAFLEAAAQGTLPQLEPWGCLMRENGLAETSIARQPEHYPASYGILSAFGEQDKLVNTPVEQEAFESLCAQGMPLEYLECAGAGHVETTLWALPELFDFMDARLAGEEFKPACAVTAAVQCRGTQR